MGKRKKKLNIYGYGYGSYRWLPLQMQKCTAHTQRPTVTSHWMLNETWTNCFSICLFSRKQISWFTSMCERVCAQCRLGILRSSIFIINFQNVKRIRFSFIRCCFVCFAYSFRLNKYCIAVESINIIKSTKLRSAQFKWENEIVWKLNGEITMDKNVFAITRTKTDNSRFLWSNVMRCGAFCRHREFRLNFIFKSGAEKLGTLGQMTNCCRFVFFLFLSLRQAPYFRCSNS